MSLKSNTTDLENILQKINNLPNKTIVSLTDITVTPAADTQVVRADDAYTGINTVTVNGDSNLASSNIIKDVEIFGVTGTAQVGISTSDATARAEDILDGATAYINDVKVEGTMANNGTVSQTLDKTNTSYTIPQGYHNGLGSVVLGDISPNLQSKTVTPNETKQEISADAQYDGLSSVSVGAISSTYVGSGVARKTSTNLTASGATVTVPAGYYVNEATKTIESGSTGTPTASKGTVSNHSISVTPSVTNTTGYITGGTKSGTAVTVSASELVSGTLSITENGTKDVTNYASVNINVNTTPNLQSKIIDPSTSIQTVSADSSYDGLSSVQVNAIQTETLEIVENGTFTPSSGKFFSSVTVNVPAQSTGGDYNVYSTQKADGTQALYINTAEGGSGGDVYDATNYLSYAVHEDSNDTFNHHIGYITNKYMQWDDKKSTNNQNVCLSGFLPIAAGETYRLSGMITTPLKNADDYPDDEESYYASATFYDINFERLTSYADAKYCFGRDENNAIFDANDELQQFTLNKVSSSVSMSDVAYMRLGFIKNGTPRIEKITG